MSGKSGNSAGWRFSKHGVTIYEVAVPIYLVCYLKWIRHWPVLRVVNVYGEADIFTLCEDPLVRNNFNFDWTRTVEVVTVVEQEESHGTNNCCN